MNRINQKIEEIANEALKLLQDGKTVPEILNLFPQQRTELKPLLENARLLTGAARAIKPRPELLHDIIKNAASQKNVTNAVLAGYDIKGRNNASALIMNKWTSWLPIGALAVILIIVAMNFSSTNSTDGLSLQAIDNELLALETLDYQINDVLDAESSINDIDSSLTDFAGSQSAGPNQSDFDSASLDNESEQINSQEIDEFFQEQDDIQTVNSGLNI